MRRFHLIIEFLNLRWNCVLFWITVFTGLLIWNFVFWLGLFRLWIVFNWFCVLFGFSSLNFILTFYFICFDLFILVKHKLEPFLFLFFLFVDLLFNFVHLDQNILIFWKFIRLVQVVKSNFDVFRLAIDVLKICLGLFIVNFGIVFIDFKGLFWRMDSLISFIHFSEGGRNVQVKSNQMGFMFLLVLGLWFVVFINDIFVFEILIFGGMDEAKNWQCLLVLTQGFTKVLQKIMIVSFEF